MKITFTIRWHGKYTKRGFMAATWQSRDGHLGGKNRYFNDILTTIRTTRTKVKMIESRTYI